MSFCEVLLAIILDHLIERVQCASRDRTPILAKHWEHEVEVVMRRLEGGLSLVCFVALL